MKELNFITIQRELESASRIELMLRIDRALSFVERWQRQLEKEPDNQSLKAALAEMTDALLSHDYPKDYFLKDV